MMPQGACRRPRMAQPVPQDVTAPAFILPLAKGLLMHLGRAAPPRSSRRPRGGSDGNDSVPPSRPGTPRFAMSAAGMGSVMAGRSEIPAPTRVLLLISDTGGGHRASAEALTAAFHELYGGQVETRTVDFWTEIAGRPFDKFPAGYSFLAKNPALWRVAWQYGRFPITRRVTEEISNVAAHRKFRDALDVYRPHLIVSVHPLTQFIPLRVLRSLPLDQRPAFVTVCTDLAGAHPTWFHRDADLVFVPSIDVQRIALRCGVDPSRLRLLGLPVRRPFWHDADNKERVRTALGIRDAPTALVVGGGDGVGGVGKVAEAIARRAQQSLGSSGAQVVVVCGRNEALARKLRQQSWPVPVRVEGFVNNMSDWMAASDLIVSKAGPGTIAEALIRGLPIVLSGYLPGQEQPNVKFVTDNGAGEFSRNPSTIAQIAVEWLGNPDKLRRRSETAKKMGRPNSTYDIVTEIGSIVNLRATSLL